MTEIIIPTLEECVLDLTQELPEQPNYYNIPEVFHPVWFTYRRPEVDTPPNHLLIYHALPDGGTLFYQIKRLSDGQGLDRDIRHIGIHKRQGKFRTTTKDEFDVRMDNSIKTNPLDEATRAEILELCSKPNKHGAIVDAVFFPNVVKLPTKFALKYAAGFAQIYFLHEYYDSDKGYDMFSSYVR